MIKRVLSRCVVMVCMVLLTVIADCGRASSEEEVEIKGTVFAIDNDESGKAIEVSVLDRAGNEYFVVHDQTGDQLLKMVDKNVTVTGVVNVDKGGKRRIRVKRFEAFPG